MRRQYLTVACTLSFACMTLAQAACDPEVVKSEREAVKGFGTLHEGKGAADFRWAPLFDGLAPGARAAMMKYVASWDHCETGKSREIDFYLHGKLIAQTLADGRYLPVDEAFDDGPQIKIWIKTGAK